MFQRTARLHAKPRFAVKQVNGWQIDSANCKPRFAPFQRSGRERAGPDSYGFGLMNRETTEPVLRQGTMNFSLKYKKRPNELAELASSIRPQEWEEDISRNSLDDRPFENLPPISERDESELANPERLLPEYLRDGSTIQELAARDPFPIPCPADREGYSPGFDGQYWMSGLADHLKIVRAATGHGVAINRYFDFGCASGRVIRHFCAQTDVAEIWGSDINQRHIRWLYEHLPARVKPVFNHCIPTLPIPDNYLDLVSAFSVFTHIDTFETAWLAELRRILRPGGIAYLTVHNEDTWSILREEIDNPKNRLIQSILSVDPEFAERIKEEMPDCRTIYRHTVQGPYRAQVFHSNNYLKKVWGRFFDLLEILPAHHVRQTVVVLRKPE